MGPSILHAEIIGIIYVWFQGTIIISRTYNLLICPLANFNKKPPVSSLFRPKSHRSSLKTLQKESLSFLDWSTYKINGLTMFFPWYSAQSGAILQTTWSMPRRLICIEILTLKEWVTHSRLSKFQLKLLPLLGT